jgi:hypothetical protein
MALDGDAHGGVFGKGKMTGPETHSAPTASTGVEGGASKLALQRPAMTVLLLAIAAGLLAPIWTVRYPLLVDYPNHLASAFVLAHLRDAAFHFNQYYRAAWNTYPYLSMDVILLGLQHFVSIELAGRLFLSLCVLSVPAAAWFFIRRANPGEESLVFWSLLVCNNLYFFRFGFLNLQLSMAICFLLLGLWLWHLERPRLGTWCGLLLVTTALYFTHLVGFAVAAVVMTAYGFSARRPFKDMVSAWALYIPGMLCYLHSVVGHGARGGFQFRALADKIGSLISVMVACSPAVDLLTLLVLLGVLAWAQIDNPEFQWNRHWRRATAILFLFYWILPAVIGPATNVDKRILPFVFVLSLAGAKVGRRGRKLAMIAVLLFFIRAGALERNFVSAQPHFVSLAGAISSIPPGARVLPLVDWAGGASWPERHFWAYGVIARGWVTPCLFHDPGVHPFTLKDDPYDPCGLAITPATSLDWGRVGREFDYVWAYHVPQFSSSLSSAGKIVFAGENLQVFQLGKAADGGKEVRPSPTP